MLKARGFWGAIGLFGGLLIVAYLAAPRIKQFSPNSQSPHVSAAAPIRISFSRPMDRVSVETRFAISPEVPGQIDWQADTLVFRPARSWDPGTTVEVRLLAGARSTLFLPILSSFSWSFEIGQARLSYLWPADSAADLYIYDLVTDETERITQSEAGVLDYTLAGTTIVYAELREDGTTALQSFDLDTGEDRSLLACPASERCQSPAIDPSGELLAYERFEWQTSESGQSVPGLSQILLMPVNGAAEPSAVPAPGQSLKTPSWSPSGILAYYNATLQAVGLIRPGSNSPPTMIPNGLGLLGSWSPDGRYLLLPEIAFPGSEAPGEVEFYSHLFQVDALSAAVTELSQGSVEDASPSYSPDGEWIAFTRKFLDERWTPGRQLWLMRADGSQARQLTDQPDFGHAAIHWKPDSSTLAYMQRSQTEVNLPPQIWISDLSGVRQRLLVDGGYLPRWLP